MCSRFLIILALLLPLPALARTFPSPAPTPGTSATSPQEVFSQMQQGFRADRARGQHLRYQFNLSDPQGGQWWIEIENDTCKMGRGAIKEPDVTIACTGADWVRLSNNTLSGVQAFLTGRLHIIGSRFKAHKLDELFP